MLATPVDQLEAGLHFYYGQNLQTYRLEFLWSQMYGVPPDVLERIIYAEGDRLFGLVESKLVADARARRLSPEAHPRRLAFAAWLAAHGLVGSRALFDAVGVRARHSFDDQLEEICALVRRGASTSRARRRNLKRKGNAR
jgi:hypothetical protein